MRRGCVCCRALTLAVACPTTACRVNCWLGAALGLSDSEIMRLATVSVREFLGLEAHWLGSVTYGQTQLKTCSTC